jgi:hypothetical protein
MEDFEVMKVRAGNDRKAINALYSDLKANG